MARVVVVGCAELGGRLQSILADAGHEVTVQARGPDLCRVEFATHPDAIVCECQSFCDCLKTLSELRNLADAPILVLGAGQGEDVIVALLRAGADDFLAIPFSEAELLARIEAGIRRYSEWNDAVRSEHLATRPPGREVALTPVEASLLACLAERPGEVVPREKLRCVILGDEADTASSGRLNVHIHNLRRKLERDPHRPEYIRTKWGVGYYLSRAVDLL